MEAVSRAWLGAAGPAVSGRSSTIPEGRRVPVGSPGRSVGDLMEYRRGAYLRVRAGSQFEMEAHVDVKPLNMMAISALVTGILMAVPWIIRAAKERSRELPEPARDAGRSDVRRRL